MLSTLTTARPLPALIAWERQYEAYRGFAMLLARLTGHRAYRIGAEVAFYG